MSKPRLLIFASGSADGGGSGYENLVLRAREGVIQAEIAGVVSNYANGGVAQRAKRLGELFIHFPPPWDAPHYAALVRQTGAHFVALSGWLKLVKGLDPRTTFNIHPGPLPEFGGVGMHGHHVHAAVLDAYRRGELTCSAVTMHFVTDEYDRGPVFFQRSVPIWQDDTPNTLAKRVNAEEHRWQPSITDAVVTGRISWNGYDPGSLSRLISS